MSYKLRNPLSPDDLRHAISRKTNLHMIDVRTPGEFEGGHVEGSQNVPLNELETHADVLAKLAAPIVLVCRSGARARSAEGLLRQAGARSLHVLDGGVLAWSDAGQELREPTAPSGGLLRRTASLLGFGPQHDSTPAVEALVAADRRRA
jgi:rhodanese-related sulfurtransferase